MVELSSSETAPVIEEAAILFANEQDALVEQMLQSAIQEDDLGGATHTAWWMLFDLYQIMGKTCGIRSPVARLREQVRNLAAAVAVRRQAERKKTKPAGATPTIAFSGRLDAGIDKQLERMHKLSEKKPQLPARIRPSDRDRSGRLRTVAAIPQGAGEIGSRPDPGRRRRIRRQDSRYAGNWPPGRQ
ncbi:hypothetical protein ACFS07_03395 [Undibacterium arcticum]